MFTLFVILTIISALLLIGVVLIQKSKGGGLSSTFAGSNQIMGVRRTNNFIEKVTWSLAGAIAVFAILSAFTMESGAIQSESRVKTSSTPATEATYDATAAEAAPADSVAPVVAPADSAK